MRATLRLELLDPYVEQLLDLCKLFRTYNGAERHTFDVSDRLLLGFFIDGEQRDQRAN